MAKHFRRQTQKPEGGPIRQPQKCDCFGGFCMRNLCHHKARKPATQDNKEQSPRPRTHTVAWRWDGSHENGPIPRGRLPEREK